MRRLLSALVAVAAAATLTVTGASTANALFGMPDALPSGSWACTDWVQSSQGVTIRGIADYNPATFTTRMASSVGGPETTVDSAVAKGELQIQEPGKEYPTYNIPVNPRPGVTAFFRNCIEATSGPQYRFGLTIGANQNAVIDLGPHEARLGPGGKHCGDWVAGPWDGAGGNARIAGNANVPVRFYLMGTDGESYASRGSVFQVTGSAVNVVYVADPRLSDLRACVENTSTATATVSFELSPA
jgi:hypothetical protein